MAPINRSRRFQGPAIISLILFLILTPDFCTSTSKINRKNLLQYSSKILTNSINAAYKTFYLEVPVDHFGFANQDTFKLRYLVADQFWDVENGPVFFYTGNEGDITLFSDNTGLMWEAAPEFKALVVFAEHRYYGKSLPYGKKSYTDKKYLGYLSSEQALADFAVLISYMKKSNVNLEKAPFVAFGGSYGGMLSAWMRMKYPNLISGALAASAPIWAFGNLTECDTYSRITTQDYTRESKACSDNIRASWDVINAMGKTAEGREKMSDIFKLCKPLNTEEQVVELKNWLVEMYGNLAMVNYPYAANFLEPLPGWPIKHACSYISDPNLSKTETPLLVGISGVTNTYFNFTGNMKCFDIFENAVESLGEQGWDFQSCTEMTMPMCSTGINDMFENSPWNFEEFAESCEKQWGVRPDINAAINEYGGKNIQSASNIIFSNGDLDPWSGLGVLQTISDTVVSILIKDGAHHLDLRSSNPKDPISVTSARQKEKRFISKWIQEFKDKEKPVTNLYGDSGQISQNEGNGYLMFLFIGCLVLSFLCIALYVTSNKKSNTYIIIDEIGNQPLKDDDSLSKYSVEYYFEKKSLLK